PHPSTFLPPDTTDGIDGYYVITVGQEVGIFFQWSARVTGVPDNSHKRFKTFATALQAYTTNYNEGLVYATPVPNSPFW
ncbi:hypothetical protein M404DRAFT_71965, partial [Pisolithus tinctorius Marx 270]